MHAEIIAVGDELTSGQRLDTNTQWIAQRLGELGIPVLFHTTVADELEACTRAFAVATDRVEMVVATGGLGPTADDLTRDAIAACTGRALVLDREVLEEIRQRFATRRRPMPQRNEVQAMFPSGSRVIPNPHGTAPGIDLSLSRPGRPQVRILALPGVPAEMVEMWHQTVQSSLRSATGRRAKVICHRRLKCFGVGESDLEQMLPDLVRRGRDPSVGITVHKATITLRVTAAASDRQAATEAMGPTIEIIREALGKLVFGEEDDELQHAVGRLLGQRGETLATAECGSRGLLGHWLGTVPELVNLYRGGLVVSGPDAASALLGIPQQRITESELHGEEVAGEMAAHVRRKFDSDYGLAIGAFPDPLGEEPSPPMFFVGLASSAGLTVKSRSFAGHPDILVERSTKQALDLLRLQLQDE